jgi:two-component system phosphate regulon sensor histidine kinase PhoR
MKARRQLRNLALPLVAVVAIVALGASSVVGVRSAYRTRVLEERTLRDFATLAAIGYSNRTFSMLLNAAVPAMGAAGKRGERSPEADLAHLAATVDSLRGCCPVSFPVRSVASGLWSDPGSIRLRSRAPITVADSVARMGTLRSVAEWDSIGGTLMRFATGGTPATPSLFVVLAQYDRARQPAGFVAMEIDLSAAADSMFGSVFHRGAPLLPASMAGVKSNNELGLLTLADSTGRIVFRSSTGVTSVYGATVPLGRRGDLFATLSLSDAAVRGLLRGSVPGQGAGTQSALALLSLVLALVIVATMYRAQRLARLRSEFAAAVTHELRTPLTHILLSAETLSLRRERSPAERGEFVEAIIRESRRLIRLIDNVLHYSRAERRLLRVQTRAERIDTIVETAIRERAQSADPGAASVVHRSDGPATAAVDADALLLVLSNLIDNAVRHGGGTTVQVTTSPLDNGAEILVQDEGPGIAPRDRERVLQPFVRLPGAEVRHPTGSGIGLAVVAEIIDAMAGHLSIESAGAKGTRVRIALPAAAVGPAA